MSVTITHIAEHCGLSRATVSRVLSGKTAHSGKTAEHVIAAADRLGYRPNAAARSTSTGRFGAVGLLLGSHDRKSSLPQGLLSGVYDVLEQHDLQLMMVRVSDADLSSRERMPRLLREMSTDGILIDYTHAAPAAMQELLERHRTPAVWMNSKQATSAVYPDDEKAGYDATVYLLEMGHRRIMYAGPSPTREVVEHYSVEDRLLGYTRAMRNAGLTPRYRLHGGDTQPQAFADVLALDDRPTAVVCYGLPMNLITYALHAGLAIPKDLSLITFIKNPDGFGELPITGRALSRLNVPHHRVGHVAASQLCAQFKDTSNQPAAVAVAFDPPLGETCCPPSA